MSEKEQLIASVKSQIELLKQEISDKEDVLYSLISEFDEQN